MNSEDTNQDKAIAVMANDISYIKDSLRKIDQRLEIMDSHYIKRDEVQNMKVEAEKIHDAQEKRIKELEINAALDRQAGAVFRAQVMTWGAAAIVVSGIAQFLIGKFL